MGPAPGSPARSPPRSDDRKRRTSGCGRTMRAFAGRRFSSRGARPPKPLTLAFIEEMRAEGCAVESILRVLRQQDLQVAARTYRSWKRPARIAARTVIDALVEDKIRAPAWKVNEATGVVQMIPEGLHGRRISPTSAHGRSSSTSRSSWTCSPSVSPVGTPARARRLTWS